MAYPNRGAGSWGGSLTVRELRPGLWHWEAPHPEWRPTEPWSENVSSYAIDDDERLLLFDPLGVPSEIEALGPSARRRSCSTVLWVESRRAEISGDTLVDFGRASRSTRGGFALA